MLMLRQSTDCHAPRQQPKEEKTVAEAVAKLLSTPHDYSADAENVNVDANELNAAAAELVAKAGAAVYASSITPAGERLYFLTRERAKRLGIARIEGGELKIELHATDHENAAALRKELPFLAPSLLGLETSLGLGDRLGLATPGHIRAIRGTCLGPILAQQSIREMERTNRTPDDVMDAATWGVLQEGYREGFGSDADHLKTKDDIDATAAAGFTMFTIDPGDHVNDDADTMDAAALDDALARVPWDDLATTQTDTDAAYAGKSFDLGDSKLDISPEAVARAAVKYGAAVAHVIRMQRHLESVFGERPFELEMSVDETDSPTSSAEHFYVASELARIGVRPVSLAPRFVGDFEKGVDYIGDIDLLESTFIEHVAIARTLGPYKISIHSGSDKFGVYEIASRIADGLVHVKTAGTSYLEALRAVATMNPQLFREILAFSFDRWDEDRATYHVSADPAKVGRPEDLADDQLPTLLDQFDARQLLHVTYGSVLRTVEGGEYVFRDRLYDTLAEHEEEHYAALEAHLGKHAAPFAK